MSETESSARSSVQESTHDEFRHELVEVHGVRLSCSYLKSLGQIALPIKELAADMYSAFNRQWQGNLDGQCKAVASQALHEFEALARGQASDISGSIYYSLEIGNHPILVAGDHAVLVIRDFTQPGLQQMRPEKPAEKTRPILVAIDLTYAARAKTGHEPDFQVQLIKVVGSEEMTTTLAQSYGGDWRRLTRQDIEEARRN